MKSRSREDTPSSAAHSQNIQRQLSELIEHLHEDMDRVNDPRFRGLLEKSEEVLTRLRTLFERFTPQEGAKAKRASDNSAGPSGPNKKSQPKTDRTQPKRATKKTEDAAPASRTTKPTEKKPGPAKPTKSAELPSPAPVPSKAVDPDEVSARDRLQRQEARAPKMPRGPVAPKPMPPQSGKPVWSQPHSS